MTTETTDNPPALVAIESPYPDTKFGGPETMRLTIDAPRADVQAIRIADMRKGATYFALQHFIKCLANECRRNSWGINDSDKLCAFILDRCRESEQGDGRDQNDRRGVGGLREDGASEKNVRPARQRKQTAPHRVEGTE